MIDPKLDLFLSKKHQPDLFRSFAYEADIWDPTPWDCKVLHSRARSTLLKLVDSSWANLANTPDKGRILLIRGESGAGKTHLLRTVRSELHSSERAFVAYMQAVSIRGNYGKYLLQKLVSSFDRSCTSSHEKRTALQLLSDHLVEDCIDLPKILVQRLRETNELTDSVHDDIWTLAETLSEAPSLAELELNTLRALLYLQIPLNQVKRRVLMYLRGEPLGEQDQRVLRDMPAKTSETDILNLITQLILATRTILMRCVVICLDQLEDLYDQHNVQNRTGTTRLSEWLSLARTISELPGTVVVVCCIDTIYRELRAHLDNSVRGRLETEPPPETLVSKRSEEEARALISSRLRYLYQHNPEIQLEENDISPIPQDIFNRWNRESTRTLLADCNTYRSTAQNTGQLPPAWPIVDPLPPPPPPIELEHKWNKALTQAVDIPEDGPGLAALLLKSIKVCGQELKYPDMSVCKEYQKTSWIQIAHNWQSAPTRLLLCLCEGSIGSSLIKQVKAVKDACTDKTGTPIVIRSTKFPNSGQAVQILKELETIHGGRRVIVENGDWRTMLVFQKFSEEHRSNPGFKDFLYNIRPLTQLQSLRDILGMLGDQPPPGKPEPSPDGPTGRTFPPKVFSSAIAYSPPQSPANSVAEDPDIKSLLNGSVQSLPAPATNSQGTPPLDLNPNSILLGHTLGRSTKEIAVEVQSLKRHVAFLGGTGSGKTTAALALIESLLIRGVSAVLIDRKGDLCGYGSDMAWERSWDIAERDTFRGHLKEAIDIDIYTPGKADGRGLRINILPQNASGMNADDFRKAVWSSADGLSDMLNLGKSRSDQAERAVLRSALEFLARDIDGDLTLMDIIEFLREPDEDFLSELGALSKYTEKLCLTFEIHARTKANVIGEGEAPFEINAMFRPSTGKKARLSIISTKFLGSDADVQFWVGRFLSEVYAWANRNPTDHLQGVLMLDEADIYLPATRQPASKQPVEDLLRRARSMGLSVFLATQSPGDLDYRCRDNILTWFVGLLTQARALDKLKDMFAEARADTSALAGQSVGQFHLLAGGKVNKLKMIPNSVKLPSQVSDDEILTVAQASTHKEDGH